ncbi:hypothetical protein [Marinobacter salarius]|uniref:hypothetical protein n=1 Tax=Marinobacter salarius TaxID=1420917 RepID=UPI0032EBDE13
MPRLSVVWRDGIEVVFVARGSRAVAVPVEMGWREPDCVEVTQGLLGSDRIIVEGATRLTDGSLLQEITPEK